MRSSRRRLLTCAVILLGPIPLLGQEIDTSSGIPQIGILLDVSSEMGFVIPLVRKERRLLDQQLVDAGRSPVAYREMPGCDLDREKTLSIPARENAFFYLRDLFEIEKADTVIWISSLQGLQSGAGFLEIHQLLETSDQNRPRRRLFIHQAWQDQIQKGDPALRRDTPPLVDPLDPEQRPGSWYRLVESGHGRVIRSWQVPPSVYRDQFGFPVRIRSAAFLRAAGFAGPIAEFDTSWNRDFRTTHKLSLLQSGEEWNLHPSGAEWIRNTTLLPFPSIDPSERDETLVHEMSKRDTIEQDLAGIESNKLGVLFAFGYVDRDLARFASRGERVAHPTDRYIAALSGIAEEAKNHLGENSSSRPNRIYAEEWVELANPMRKQEGPDPIALRLGRFIREENLDDVYLFTNGFVGGGRYGTVTLDEKLIAQAIGDTGARLHIRMPFETGSCPVSLEKIANASGGSVFRGRQSDADWNYPRPPSEWPEPRSTE